MTTTAAEYLELREAARSLRLRVTEVADDIHHAANLLHAASARVEAAEGADRAAWASSSPEDKAAVQEIAERLLGMALDQAADAVTRVAAAS